MQRLIERWIATHINGFEGEARATEAEALKDAEKYNDETMIPMAKAADEEPVLCEVVKLCNAALVEELKGTVALLEQNRIAQKRELKALYRQLHPEEK